MTVSGYKNPCRLYAHVTSMNLLINKKKRKTDTFLFTFCRSTTKPLKTETEDNVNRVMC